MDAHDIRRIAAESATLQQRFFAESAERFPHGDTARVQEVHTVVVHVLCQIVEEATAR